MGHIHWRTALLAFFAFLFTTFSPAKPISAKDQVTIYWTDLGINQMQSGFKLGDNFKDFSQKKKDTVIVGNTSGQILVPMPADKDLPDTDAEWTDLSSQIYESIKSRAQEGLSRGVREFEIRTVQNINAGGYFNPVRQGNVVKFSAAFAKALEKVGAELNQDYNTDVFGLWASNGGYAASKALPLLGRQVVASGVLVDARAWKSDVKSLTAFLGGNLTIINTAGDAPARYQTRPIPILHIDENMVAHHATARALKKEIPGIKLFWLDAEGLDVVISKHIRFVNWDSKFEVKEYTGTGYQKLGRMTGGDLRNMIFRSSINPGVPGDQDATKKEDPDTVKKRQVSSASFSPPPPPPPPPGGGGGGAVVGGVDIAVSPESSGKIDPRVKELILKSKPSAEVLQRSVLESGKEEE